MFALLGDITLGLSPLTGPTGSEAGRAVDYAEHAVVRGTPVLQDMGDALGTRRLSFVFDESFCEPAAELAKLHAAIAARSPMALVFGDGGRPASYVAKTLDETHRKTTAGGTITRLEATLTLTEAPIPIALAFDPTAPAVLARALVNPLTQR